ncbi:hypothetical protein HMPREF0220_0913 [Clostridioides difficile NAP08]|uniref:Uncharacterized protein n=1 Tax=Clostridioides difficile NAP08 TaxID=525259 RepID=D5Q1Y1_CLODI|nr:hypothetical protein HMPREF0220_0913 [Clostridioides difficile NAP08]EFH16571.1 hypothetical protein HMPREF0219_0817 [Clostridioides difficile NAP07]CCK88043.1 conserved hypothetical protein [Clostridioides difficile T5]CCK91483.1 conserved hypothetical protein [Clostridioides difficile T20]CCK95181.1 conserved hypothetical protein [Clostridioides difficile E1]CCK99138.1 conserved hypothetical protein [Clostridioides difficile E10]
MAGHIVGMASYKIFPAKNRPKVGYLETVYVKKRDILNDL